MFRSPPRLFKLFFHLLYHQLAWSYDWVAAVVSLGMWKRWIRAALPYLNGPRVLELGQGPGHLQVALREKGFAAFGLDASISMSQQARRRLQGAGFVPGLVNCYSQHAPFKNERFDEVVATFPTEYIFDPYTLSEIMRLLRPGGQLIILPFAWITGKGFHERFLAWLSHQTGQTIEWDESWLAPLRQSGFQVVSVERIHYPYSQVVIIKAQK